MVKLPKVVGSFSTAGEDFDRPQLQCQRQPPSDHPDVMLDAGQLSDRAVAAPHAQNRIADDCLAVAYASRAQPLECCISGAADR